jgi:DNA-nicking Smr family endonuclease
MTGRKRETSGEERALFQDSFKEVRPVAPSKAEPAVKAKPQAARTIRQQPGLDGSTAERLRRGRLEPEARLDLHGLTEAGAHRALVRFLRTSHLQGLRLVLVVTGKGAPQADDAAFDLELHARSRGVLKTMTPRWLKEPELAAVVADTRSAHRRHGGAGALYVYLRKPPR